MLWYQLIGVVMIIIGAVFLFLGALGVLRMPDVFNRMQAGTKSTTLGALSVIMGVGIYHPAWILKTGIISLFLLLTNPVSSNVLSRAAHNSGVELSDKTVVDKYAEDKEGNKGKQEVENG